MQSRNNELSESERRIFVTWRPSSLYLHSLFVLVSVQLLITLIMNIAALFGVLMPFAKCENELLYCGFAVLIVTAGLAKDRNFWKNEFKCCPKWLRRVSVIIAIYGLFFALVGVLSFKSSHDPIDLQLCASSAFLSFGSMAVCVVYALLWGKEISSHELHKRIRTSIVMLVVFVMIIAISR